MADVNPETARSLPYGVGVGTLCGSITDARGRKRLSSLDAMLGEFMRRNPEIADRWVENLKEGTVSTGMPERIAACSWNATIVGQTIGYGQHSKQYQSGGGYSYFFVNGRTGKVEYISS